MQYRKHRETTRTDFAQADGYVCLIIATTSSSGLPRRRRWLCLGENILKPELGSHLHAARAGARPVPGRSGWAAKGAADNPNVSLPVERCGRGTARTPEPGAEATVT